MSSNLLGYDSSRSSLCTRGSGENVVMNVGVVGGSGFIGSHILDQFLAKGVSVTDFDIMPPRQAGPRHIYVDILDSSKAVIALAGEFDAIFMLAAIANVG